MNFPVPRLIPVNGIELAVYEAGQGGMPIVLAHGWPELAYSWRYQIPELVRQGYHVIVPDQRGYGLSSKPTRVEDYDIHHLTGDHVALLDALNIDKAIYVGHDWGAIVVWYQALLHPERVLGVANLSVPFWPREPADPIAFWEKMLGPDFYIVHFNRQPGVAAAAFDRHPEQFLRNMYRTKQWLNSSPSAGEPNGQTIIQLADTVIESGEPLLNDADFKVFLSAFKAGGFTAPCQWYRNFTRNWATTEQVEQRIRQPALMIYGEYDMVRKADMTAYVADLEVHTLPCGHWIQQELPQETNRLLLDWLERRMRPFF